MPSSLDSAPAQYTLGIDLGGTKIAAAVVDVTCGAIQEKVQVPTPTTGQPAVFKAMIDIAKPLLANYPIIDRIGVASPGPLDRVKGEVIFAPNIHDMNNAPIVPALHDGLGKDIRLENDANAAGYAEHCYGAAQHVQSSVYITLSTGIGGGIFLHNKIWRGAQELAGEIGHMTLAATGSIGGDGHSGSWEAIAAGRAIAKQGQYALNQDTLTTADVFELAAQGDRHATAIVNRAAQYTGLGIANLQKIINPHMFVVGGGMSQVGGAYFDEIHHWLAHYLVGYPQPNLAFAALGTDAGVIGAAAIALLED